MPKKLVVLDGLLNTDTRPTDTGIPQRGAASSRGKKPLKNREGERRVTLALMPVPIAAYACTPPTPTRRIKPSLSPHLRNISNTQARKQIEHAHTTCGCTWENKRCRVNETGSFLSATLPGGPSYQAITF